MKPEVLPAKLSDPARSVLHALALMACGAAIGTLVFVLTFTVIYAFHLVVS